MRKIFAIILIALLLGVGVVAVIKTDPGYVLMSYGNYTLETSLWVGLVLLLLFTALVYAVLRLVYRLLGGHRSLVGWLDSRRVRQAARHTTQGLISLIEGNWATSRRQLLRGAPHSELPLVNYLLAARASAELHDTAKMSEYLGAAQQTGPDASTAVELARAAMLLDLGEFDQAAAALDQLEGAAASTPRALVLRYRTHFELQHWDELAAILPELKKRNLVAAGELQKRQRDIDVNRLQAADSPQGLSAAWQKLPKDRQHDTGLVRIYAGLLLRAGDGEAARKVLVKALKREWDPALADLYGRLEETDTSAALAQAERWLAAHPEDPQLLLALGRLAAREKLWGKARDYFESSYRLQRTPEVCAELGRLLTGTGDTGVAAAYFREGLLLCESELPTLPVPDKAISRAQQLAASQGAKISSGALPD